MFVKKKMPDVYIKYNCMLIYTISIGGMRPVLLANALDDGGNIRTYQVPISIHDNDNNGNDTAGT